MRNCHLNVAGKHILRAIRVLALTIMACAATGSQAQITGWSSRPGWGSITARSVAFGNGLYVATLDSDTNSIIVSTNGTDWVRRLLPYSLINSATARFVNGRFYLLSVPMRSSADALNWLSHSNTVVPTGLVYANGKYVQVSSRAPSITVSTDATNWIVADSSQLNLYDITFGAGLFVACGDGGIIISSPDGLNWTYALPDSAGTTPRSSICYGNGIFLVLTVPNLLLTSMDAIHWYTNSASAGVYGGHVRWGLGSFVAIGPWGIWTSRDAINWTEFGTASLLNDCTFSTTTCYAVGSTPFYESNPLVAPTNAPSALQVRLHPGIEIIGNIGSLYRIQYTDEPAQTNWVTATELYLQSNPTLWIDPQPASGNRFYRSVRLD